VFFGSRKEYIILFGSRQEESILFYVSRDTGSLTGRGVESPMISVGQIGAGGGRGGEVLLLPRIDDGYIEKSTGRPPLHIIGRFSND
jgi:hypothetical protein